MARAWTQSQPELVYCGEGDSIEEGSGQLVVARGDAVKVLETADGHLDPPALLVALSIVANRLLPIASPGNGRPDAGLAQLLAEGVGIVGAIGDQAVENGRIFATRPSAARMSACWPGPSSSPIGRPQSGIRRRSQRRGSSCSCRPGIRQSPDLSLLSEESRRPASAAPPQ
jgi:hypothetical protein